MRKCLVLIIAVFCVILCTSDLFAQIGVRPQDSNTRRLEAFDRKMATLTQSVKNLADNIAAYNNPVFEAQLTKQERRYYDGWEERNVTSNILWNRVWAKDKTIVLGGARRDKKFWAYLLKTTDPELVFIGGVRVGASINVLEKFLGEKLANIAQSRERLFGQRPWGVLTNGNRVTIIGPIQENDAPDPIIRITCVDNIITEIFLDVSGGVGLENEGVLSKEAADFANTQAQKMGLSNIK